jgi:hypothetical protein
VLLRCCGIPRGCRLRSTYFFAAAKKSRQKNRSRKTIGVRTRLNNT